MVDESYTGHQQLAMERDVEINVRIFDRDMFGSVLRTRYAPVKDDKATREFDALLAKIK